MQVSSLAGSRSRAGFSPTAPRNHLTEIAVPSLIAGKVHGPADGITAKDPGTGQRMEHHACDKALCSSEGALPAEGGHPVEPYAPSQQPGAEASSAPSISSLPFQLITACPPSSGSLQPGQKQPPSFEVQAPDGAAGSRSRGSSSVSTISSRASTISSAAKSRSPSRPSVPAGGRTSLRNKSMSVMKPKMVSVSMQWLGVFRIWQHISPVVLLGGASGLEPWTESAERLFFHTWADAGVATDIIHKAFGLSKCL